MSKKTYCDKCKKLEDHTKFIPVESEDPTTLRVADYYLETIKWDLCPPCHKLLKEWVSE